MLSQESFRRELIFLMLQFLKDEKLDETAHKLEKETGVFFDMSYFESSVTNGEWEKVDEYLLGFMKVDENQHSAKILFEIRKQKYLEALDIHDHAKAVKVLTKELKVFSMHSEPIYKELALLLSLEDIREHSEYEFYSDNKFARRTLLADVNELIRKNPVLLDKLDFPTLKDSRLKTLLNQSLSFQHYHCKNAKPIPHITTLFVDHTCEESNGALAQFIFANPRKEEVRDLSKTTYSLAISASKEEVRDLSKTSDSLAISSPWNMTGIIEQSQLRSLKLPDPLLSVKVIRLMYTSSGKCILALTDNAVHKLWKWEQNERNLTGQATASVPPQLYQPPSGILMTNETKLGEAVTCLALSKTDSYVLSSSGGKISIFNIINFRVMATFMPPPPAATCVAFHPEDNNVIVIGMEDTSIRIYDARMDKVLRTLMGHGRRVTGLAFSSVLGILVSSGADAQLCVWSVKEWKYKATKFLQIPREYDSFAQTRVQFDKQQTRVLVVHESKIAVYELPGMYRICQRVAGKNGAVTDATYSSDGKWVYASFKDRSVGVFAAFMLTMRCRINPISYLPSMTSSLKAYPVVIAAHPCKPNQFAIGFSDGEVYVLEPLEEQGT